VHRASFLCAPGTREARAALTLAVTASAGFLAFLAYTLTDMESAAVDTLFNDGLYNAVQLLAVAGCVLRLICVKADRAPWTLLTCGLGAWATADLIFSFAYGNAPHYPSVADAFYLAYYPLCYVGLLLLVRRHIADFNRSLWLDGITAALGSAALGAVVLVETVLETTEGSRATVITNISYPLGDVLLLSIVVGVFALSGWRPGRTWLLLGLGLMCQVVADSVFLFEEAADAYVPGSPADAAWPLGMLLIAFAAWQAPSLGTRRHARPWLATPTIAALVAIGVLVYDHYSRQNPLAIVFSVATLMVVLVRMWMTFREKESILDQIRWQAVTDSLTGLGNRRSLVDDLDAALANGVASEAQMLVIFDLDGFKRYNDTFGHPAGDALLERLGHQLLAAVGDRAKAYRLGGDEFCVLASAAAGPGALLDVAVAALSEHSDSFSVTTSFGAVFVPDETTEPSEALRLADQRLYTQKYSNELTRARPHEVLLQALSEREPRLLEHSRDVATLSIKVARRLDLADEDLTVLRIAAELHDVGKLAIPDAILVKEEPLTPAERMFIEQHPLIGQRIVSATPALQTVGRIVRASHERWDGTGYVDGLAGEEIPLEARIIAICDAFTAMTTDRPYSQTLTVGEALAELRRCSGSQFDPGVVAAFEQAVRAGEIDPAEPAFTAALRRRAS